MKKVLAVVLVLSLVFSVFGISKVSAEAFSFTLKRTIVAESGSFIFLPASKFPIGIVMKDKDLKDFASLMFVSSTPQAPYFAQISFILPDGKIFNPTGEKTNISNLDNAYLFTVPSPQFKVLAVSIHDFALNTDIQQVTLSCLGTGQGSTNSLKFYNSYKGTLTESSMVATDDGTVVFGTLKLNTKKQISTSGSSDYYGRVVKVDSSAQTVTTHDLIYSQLYSFAPQGMEVSIPLSLDGNILYLLVSRRGVIKNGKIIAGLYSIWKIDLSQDNKIIAAYDAVFGKDDTYAVFYPIPFAQTAQDKIPVIEAVAKADLTTGAKVSGGNIYIATVDRNTLKVDDWLIDTGISQNDFLQATYSNGIVVIMGYVGNNNVIKAFDINKKQALWTEKVPVSNFYLSQDGVLYLVSEHTPFVTAKDALTGNDLATYKLPEGAKYSYLFTVDPSSNTIWVRYWDDNKKVNCFAELSLTKTYTITTSAGSGGTISPSGTVTVKSGDSATFIITPDSGYAISDVKVDGKSVGAVSTYTFENVTSDHTIEATFAMNTYTITASAGSGGSISPSGTITVNYGESKTFTITPDKGYKISDVKVDGKSVGAVSTYTFFNITDNHTIEVTFEKNQIVIVLQVGQTTFTVNGLPNTLDSPPIIKNVRTLLPIRAIIEALGGTAAWDPTERKVTVTLGSTTIELWIGKNTARVNGIDTLIDPDNSKVVPEIINGRTMLPLRFVTENLGCQLRWDPNTKTITITYKG